MSGLSTLEAALADAVEHQDRARIAAIYVGAADAHLAAGNIDAACFFWSHALVYALAAGDNAMEQVLRDRLEQRNRL